MSTTTFAAIRAAQAGVLVTTQMTTAGHVYLKPAQDEQDFRAWVVANPAACFRRFTIVNTFGYQTPEVINSDVVFERLTERVEVAYPVALGKYGSENRRSMRDVIDEDRITIDRVIGDLGQDNYLDGQSMCSPRGYDVEDLGQVWILSTSYELGFYRAA